MKTPLRIGVNGLYLIPGGVGGTEIYLSGVLSALARIDPSNQYFVFTGNEVEPGLVPERANFHWHRMRFRSANRAARILWEQTGLPLRAASLGLDVMLNPGFTAPIFSHCPQITVFHDLQYKRHPQFSRWFDLPFWLVLLRVSAHISRVVIADSEVTRQDVLKYYRLPERGVVTVPLGVDEEFFSLASRRAPERLILSVSTLHPHKNLDGLLRAFVHFRRRHPDYRLIVCGLHGFHTAAIHQLRENLGLNGSVEFPGWLPRQEVYELYTRAAAFVYPSLFEGFGIPVVEAMAAGVPMACSRIEPLTAHVGNAGLLFDPYDPEAICASICSLVEDRELAQSLVAAGRSRARGFSWERTACDILGAINTTT